MNRKHAATAIIALALLSATSAARAQTGKVALEGRGGMAFPTGDLSRGGASSGMAAALDLIYNVRPWFSGYVGASRDEFDGDFSATGLQAGGKFIAHRDGTMLPWASAGLLWQKLNTDGADSDMELGFEAGLGADFAITDRFSLTPGVRYRSFNAGFTPGEITARYWVVALGAHLHLR
jgi:hypothetical protein